MRGVKLAADLPRYAADCLPCGVGLTILEYVHARRVYGEVDQQDNQERESVGAERRRVSCKSIVTCFARYVPGGRHDCVKRREVFICMGPNPMLDWEYACDQCGWSSELLR